MSKNNPWANRWRDLASGDGKAERAAVENEARQAEAMGEKDCGICGAKAFYRPGVGAFQCPECRALLVNGKWIQ